VFPVSAGKNNDVVPATALALRTVVPELEPVKVIPPELMVGVVSVGELLKTATPPAAPVASVRIVAKFAEVVGVKYVVVVVKRLRAGTPPEITTDLPLSPAEVVTIEVVFAADW
jgi:hypothetical protein